MARRELLLLLLLAAPASADGHRMLELLAMCERECSGTSACVVVQGEAPVCSGANVWSSESGSLHAACVAVADEECLAQIEDAIRAVSVVGSHTRDLVLDEGTVHRWRHAQLVYVVVALRARTQSRLTDTMLVVVTGRWRMRTRRGWSSTSLAFLSCRHCTASTRRVATSPNADTGCRVPTDLCAMRRCPHSLSRSFRSRNCGTCTYLSSSGRLVRDQLRSTHSCRSVADRDLRGGNFSSPVRLSWSERRFLSTQLEAFAVDESALDTQCDAPEPIGELYSVCDRSASSSMPSSSSDGSVDRVHPESASQALDKASVLSVSTGSAATDWSSSSASSSSSSSVGHTSIDALTWVVVSSVVVVVCLIILVAYCYTKWDHRRAEQVEGDEDLESAADPPTSGVRRFLTRRRRSRLQSVAKWYDDPELRRWAIDPSAIVPLRQIGSGAFSTVWLAQYTTETVVLKRFLTAASGSSSSNDTQRSFHDAFTSELSLMAALAHPKILALVGVAWTPPSLVPVIDVATDDREKVALVVEYMERGDLRAYLNATKDSDAGTGWSRRKIAIAADIAEAIAYLHAQSPPVLHRDVTSRNILLDANYTAKLADFGLSRRLRLGDGDGQEADTLAMTKGIGTSRWIAPEVLVGNGAYSPAVDVYSFGVVLAELDSHEPPFCGVSLSNGKPLSDKAVLELLRAGALAPDISDLCPKPVAALMLECLSTDPKYRPVASYAASRLRAMLERLRRVSDVGEDIASGADSGSMIEMGVDGGISSGGRVFGLNTVDSFLGIDDTYASASGTSGGESKRSESPTVSKYSLMQDSN